MRKVLSLVLALCMIVTMFTSLAATPVFGEGVLLEEAPVTKAAEADDSEEEASLLASKVAAGTDEVAAYGEYSASGISLPYNIDIHLDAATDISGVRLYGGDTLGAIPKKWELYVSFDGSTYVYVDTDSWYYSDTYETLADAQAGLATRLGYDITAVTDVRVTVKEMIDGTDLSLAKIGVIKSYADLGVTKSSNYYVIKAFGAADVEDGKLVTDEIVIKAVAGGYGGRGVSETAAWSTAKNAADGDLGSYAYTNGKLVIDLGDWYSASALRYYPPKVHKIGVASIGEIDVIPSYGDADFSGTKELPDPAASNNYKLPYTAIAYGSYQDAPATMEFAWSSTVDAPMDMKVRYIKINAWNQQNGTVAPYGTVGEFRLIKPRSFDVSGEELSYNLVPAATWKGYGSFVYNDKANAKESSGSLASVYYDHIVSSAKDYKGLSGADINYSAMNYNSAEIDFVYFRAIPGAYVDFLLDLKEDVEFSGFRIYSRPGQPMQLATKVRAEISDDGVNYVASELTTSTSNVNTSHTNNTMEHFVEGGLQLGGDSVNFKGRYLKLHITDTAGGEHLATAEIALLKPNKSLATVTASEAAAQAVIGLIDAIGTVTVDSGAAIDAARSAYDALPEGKKGDVTNYQKLLDAEEAYKKIMFEESVYVTNDIVDSYEAGSVWNDAYKPEKLFDGILTQGDNDNYWHSAVKSDVGITDEQRTVTVNFKDKVDLGGLRIYVRTDNGGGTPQVSQIMGSYDGKTFFPMSAQASTTASAGSPSFFDILTMAGHDNNVKAIKYVVKQTGNVTDKHTCYCEMQFLKPVMPEQPFEDGDFSTYPIWDISSGATSGKTFGSIGRAIDSVISSKAMIAVGEYTYQIGGDFIRCVDSSAPGAGTVWITLDLKKDVTFSGVRTYARMQKSGGVWGSQNISKGRVFVSDDGVTWAQADDISVNHNNRTADITTTFDGDTYNITARYVKLEILEASADPNWKHLSFEEIRLLNPIPGAGTYTVAGLSELYAQKVQETIGLINAIGTVTTDSKAAIDAARSAYDALPASVKGDVTNYQTLVDAEAAYKELLPQVFNNAIDALPGVEGIGAADKAAVEEVQAIYDSLSGEAKAAVTQARKDKLAALKQEIANLVITVNIQSDADTLKGYRTYKFTLRTASTVSKITSGNLELGASDYTVTDNGNGTVTVAIAGSYKAAAIGALPYYVPDDALFAADNATYGWKKNQNIKDFLSGWAAFRILNDGNLGDHFITISFADGTEKTVNIFTKAESWSNVPSKATYTQAQDEIEPGVGAWKALVTTSGNAGFAFNGEMTNWYESPYIADKYKQTTAESAGTTQVLGYQTLPITFFVDFGKKQEIAGLRLYERSGGAGKPTEFTVFGSDDFENWEKIDDTFTFANTATGKKEAVFSSKVNYRYIRIMITKANGAISGSTMSIAQISFLKATTKIVDGTTRTSDVSSDAKAISYTFNADNLTKVSSVKNTTLGKALVSGVDYTSDATGITFTADYVGKLAIGTHNFTITMADGNTLNVSITRQDSSNLTYRLNDLTNGVGDGSLLFDVGTDKTVDYVECDGVKASAINDIKAFTVEGGTLTMLRPVVRRLYDWMGDIKGNETSMKKDIVVHYTDGSSKVFHLTVSASYKVLTGTPYTSDDITFLKDEISDASVLRQWRTRVDSATALSQMDAMFFNAIPTSSGQQNWHTYYGTTYPGALGSVVDDLSANNPHYIDIDLGTSPASYSGVRFVERWENQGGDLSKAYVYGSTDGTTWVTLGENNAIPRSTPTGGRTRTGVTTDIAFGANVNYRYLRIKVYCYNGRACLNALRLLQPGMQFENTSLIYDLTQVGKEDLTVNIKEYGAVTSIASIAVGEDLLAPTDYAFSFGGKTLTLKESYLANMEPGKITYTVTANNGTTSKFTVEYYSAEVGFAEDEIATGKVYEASAITGKDAEVTTLTDGNIGQFWTSSDKNVLRYELSAAEGVSGVRFYETYNAPIAGKLAAGKVYGSTDGENFFEIGNLCCDTTTGVSYTTDFGFNIALKAVAVEITDVIDGADPVIGELHLLKAKDSYGVATEETVTTEPELYINGKETKGWSASESSAKDNMTGRNLIDGDVSTIWHTDYEAEGSTITWYPGLPQYVDVTFSKATAVSGTRYTAREGFGSAATKVNIYGSTDGEHFNLITSDEYKFNTSLSPMDDENRKTTMFGANYYLKALRFEVVGAQGGGNHATGAELELYKPQVGNATITDTAAFAPATSKAWNVSASDTAAGSDIRLAFDGNDSTVWNSGAAAPVTVEMDLGKALCISGIKINSEQAFNTAEIYLSEDGNDYYLWDDKAPFKGTAFTNEHDFQCNLTVKKVKLVFTSVVGVVAPKEISLKPAQAQYIQVTLSDQITPKATWSADATTAMSSSYNRGIDGKVSTMYHSDVSTLPAEYIVHFGEDTTISGFNYYPRRDDMFTQTSGNLRTFDIYVSGDNGKSWDIIRENEMYEVGLSDTTADGLVSRTIFDYNYTVTDVKIVAKKCSWNWLAIAELAFLKPVSGKNPVSAVLPQSEFVFESAEPEDIVITVSMNDAIRITKFMINGEPVDKDYYTVKDNVITLSKYFFGDYNYDSTGDVPFTIGYLLGDETQFVVKVGGSEKHKVDFDANGNGNIIAKILPDTEIAPEDEVRRSDKLVFVAQPDNGYEVDYWRASAINPVYEVLDRTGITATATTLDNDGQVVANGNAAPMLDGNKASYWHSAYTIIDENPVPDYPIGKDHPYDLTFTFDKPTVISGIKLLPRQDGTSFISYYTVYGSTDGENWFKLTSGMLSANTDEKDIYFTAARLKEVRLEIESLTGKWGYVAEVNFLTEKEVKGFVTYSGSASEEFVLDDLFTDVLVEVGFKEMASGTAKINQKLTNVTTDYDASTAKKGKDVIITLMPDEDYDIPAEVEVMMDGVTLKPDQDYFYDSETGKLVIANVKGNITLKAKALEIGYYSLIYKDKYGALGELPETQSVKAGKNVMLSGTTLALTGYKFYGWTDGDIVYSAGDKITMPEDNLTLYTVWVRDTGLAKEDEKGNTSGNTGDPDKQSERSGGGGGKKEGTTMIGGGAGSGATGKYTIVVNGVTRSMAAGSIVEDPTAPEGYTFLGWYLDEGLTVPYANTGVKENVSLYPMFRKNRTRATLADIKGHWAENYIGDMYEAYTVNGKSETVFDPDANITRAEFVQILYMMSAQTSDASENFTDVNVGDWFLPAVAWAVNNGVTAGTSEETFSPYANITREQMATMIYRYATSHLGMDWKIAEETLFADNDLIADYAKYQVRWAKDKGIILGRPDGTFGPRDNATRAEAVAMLSRLCK